MLTRLVRLDNGKYGVVNEHTGQLVKQGNWQACADYQNKQLFRRGDAIKRAIK
jgi:hypothetical protein